MAAVFADSRMDDFLAVIIGNGTNYGVYGMANISDRSYSQLRSIQANYVRPETLHNANDTINNATAKLAIYKRYSIQEDLIHASRMNRFHYRYSSKFLKLTKPLGALKSNPVPFSRDSIRRSVTPY